MLVTQFFYIRSLLTDALSDRDSGDRFLISSNIAPRIPCWQSTQLDTLATVEVFVASSKLNIPSERALRALRSGSRAF